MRSDSAGARLPCGKFDANATWLQLNALAVSVALDVAGEVSYSTGTEDTVPHLWGWRKDCMSCAAVDCKSLAGAVASH